MTWVRIGATMTLGHTVTTMTLDTIVAFDTVFVLIFPWLFC
jgi:hypothetical protein